MTSTNKQNIKLIIDKIKCIVNIKQELYEKLVEFLEVLLTLNDKYNEETTFKLEDYSKIISPYYYLGSSNKIDIIDFYNKTKCKSLHLAFLNGDKGIPCWSNGDKYDCSNVREICNYLHSNGGHAIISTGGANGVELVNAFDVNRCISVYSYFADLGVRHFDFDIEGSCVSNKELTKKRNQLIKELKKKYTDLVIQFTVPVSPDGLHSNELELVKETVSSGVSIDILNIMTMDFGTYYAPNGKEDMGKYCIQCLESVSSQLEKLKLRCKLGVTPMIGVNDCVDEIFSLENAKELVNYCKNQNNVYLLSFWCINRDNGTVINYNYADCNYSGICQNLYEFTELFNKV